MKNTFTFNRSDTRAVKTQKCNIEGDIDNMPKPWNSNFFLCKQQCGKVTLNEIRVPAIQEMKIHC